MTKSCKLPWLINLLFLAIILAMAYMFMLRGNTVASIDGRTAIVVTEPERQLLLGEMRGFLEAIQEITEAAGEDDMATIAAVARKVGAASTTGVPVALMGKLPLEFKTLGFSTHSLFDELAMNAETMGDSKTMIAGVATLLQNCTSCHAGYKIIAEQPEN